MTNRPYRRAQRTFWALVVLAVILIGSLGRVLQMPPSPLAGLAVAVLGTLTVIIIALATRLLLALTGRLPSIARAQHRHTAEERPPHTSGDG